jgi:hypothetical protein
MANTGQIVFAERRKRLAGTMFQAGYLLFRILHRLLTGIPVRVGNFSVIPRASLRRLVAMTELWNHYAGAVFKSKLPFFTIPADRGQRLCGESRMNLVALVAHGLAGIATFYDAVATRILIFNVVGMAVLLLVLLGGLALKLSGNPFVPGWAEYTAGLMLVLVTQLAAVSFSLVFSLIVTRGNMPFIPIRDYRIFADGVENLWSRP